jgi:hypothetical protein
MENAWKRRNLQGTNRVGQEVGSRKLRKGGTVIWVRETLHHCYATNAQENPQPRLRESTESPISVPVSPSSAVKCYPCREVPLNYNTSLLFHGGDTGSTPLRDANYFDHLRAPAIFPRINKGPFS